MVRGKAIGFQRAVVSNAITRAFAISLMLHFIAIAGVEVGRKLGWWSHSLLPSFVQKELINEVARTAQQRAELQKQLMQREPPEAELLFVDVDPTEAAPEPPRDAKYYSSHSTVASNPDKGEKITPKIDGKQDKVAKTADTLRPDPRVLLAAPPPERSRAEIMQPTPAPPKQNTPPREQPRPAPQPKGETLLAKVTPREEIPVPQNNPTPEPPQRRRPRTVAEAKAQKGILEGNKMRQEGGVPRLSIGSNLDVKATPFGSYDALFIQAVQARWFSLLDERDFVGNESGRVVVEFRLHSDGRISDIAVVNATVSEVLSWFCQRAIMDPAPYRPFPSDLRRMMNSDYREIRFTFYYNQ